MNADKYQGKYRVASARLATWDYGRNAAYFVTICSDQHQHVFGRVIDDQVHLTALGQVAWDCWHAIPDHFSFVVLGEFVAMPNHVHGIVIIDKPPSVETQNLASLRLPKNKFGPQSQNLASIVRGFKIGVTKYARQQQISFVWQARYYDHIVRNAAECDRIRQYIIENPKKWADDRFYAP